MGAGMSKLDFKPKLGRSRSDRGPKTERISRLALKAATRHRAPKSPWANALTRRSSPPSLHGEEGKFSARARHAHGRIAAPVRGRQHRYWRQHGTPAPQDCIFATAQSDGGKRRQIARSPQIPRQPCGCLFLSTSLLPQRRWS